MRGTNTFLSHSKQTRDDLWDLDRLVSEGVDRKTSLCSRDTPQIQSSISNAPDIVSKNVGLMDDWNSHPRYALILSSQFLKITNSVSELETKQQTKDRLECLECFLCFILAYLNVQHLQGKESIKGRTEKQLYARSDLVINIQVWRLT